MNSSKNFFFFFCEGDAIIFYTNNTVGANANAKK